MPRNFPPQEPRKKRVLDFFFKISGLAELTQYDSTGTSSAITFFEPKVAAFVEGKDRVKDGAGRREEGEESGKGENAEFW